MAETTALQLIMDKIKVEVESRSVIEFDLDAARDQRAVAEGRLSECEERLQRCNQRIMLLKQTVETARELDAAMPEAAPSRQQPATQAVYTPPPKPVAAKEPLASKRNPQPPKRRGRPPGRQKKQPEPMAEEETQAGQLWGGKSIEEAAAE